MEIYIYLENTTSFFIDEARDPLDASSSRQAPDGRFGDALDVITKNLPVSLGASLSKSLASFASSSHVDEFSETDAALVWGRYIYTTAATLLLVVSHFS